MAKYERPRSSCPKDTPELKRKREKKRAAKKLASKRAWPASRFEAPPGFQDPFDVTREVNKRVKAQTASDLKFRALGIPFSEPVEGRKASEKTRLEIADRMTAEYEAVKASRDDKALLRLWQRDLPEQEVQSRTIRLKTLLMNNLILAKKLGANPRLAKFRGEEKAKELQVRGLKCAALFKRMFKGLDVYKGIALSEWSLAELSEGMVYAPASPEVRARFIAEELRIEARDGATAAQLYAEGFDVPRSIALDEWAPVELTEDGFFDRGDFE